VLIEVNPKVARLEARSFIYINAGPPCAVYQPPIAEKRGLSHMRARQIDPQELSC